MECTLAPLELKKGGNLYQYFKKGKILKKVEDHWVNTKQVSPESVNCKCMFVGNEKLLGLG